jgi:glyoxylase-like metal-dependent hydrolase (beta-lactamase superfamily II)
MELDLIDYPEGISAIDSGFVRPRLDAIHMIVEKGRAAFVDTGINASIPAVLEALARKGLSPESVDYVMLTHIHLDHAGGASQMMKLFPNAKLTVHPRGARHMADPAKLWAATVEVYGLDTALKNYGEIIPIPKERIIETPDGATVSLAGRDFLFLDTPGHARHHVCIRDSRTGHFFVGDCFGLAYTELETDGRRFSFPTSSPSQFEPDLLTQTIDRVVSYQPEAVYLTHYAQIKDVPRIAADVTRLIAAHVELAKSVQASGARGQERHEKLKAGVRTLIAEEAKRQGWKLSPAALTEVFSVDDELNAQGLAIWLDAQPA